MKNMKNFLKVFIIVVLVVASIAGTCFFFFRKVKEKNSNSVSIAAFLYSSEKQSLDGGMSSMSSVVNSDGTDTRLNLIIKTNANLNLIVETLASYYVETGTKIESKKISSLVRQLSSSRNLLNNMIAEYNIKKSSSYFDRHIGANDFYNAASSYLVNYAKLANLINDNLDCDKSTDFKFNMFEIYSNVVQNSFNKTKTSSSRVVIENDANINKVNSLLKIENSVVVIATNNFGIEVNRFNQYYIECDEVEFAKNLTTNISSVNSANQDTTEKIATYYFKQIYKI